MFSFVLPISALDFPLFDRCAHRSRTVDRRRKDSGKNTRARFSCNSNDVHRKATREKKQTRNLLLKGCRGAERVVRARTRALCRELSTLLRLRPKILTFFGPSYWRLLLVLAGTCGFVRTMLLQLFPRTQMHVAAENPSSEGGEKVSLIEWLFPPDKCTRRIIRQSPGGCRYLNFLQLHPEHRFHCLRRKMKDEDVKTTTDETLVLILNNLPSPPTPTKRVVYADSRYLLV